MHGFKEAAYWWNVTLTKVFIENGYKQISNDKCVFVRSESNHISYSAITVGRLLLCRNTGDQYSRNDCPYGEGQWESSDEAKEIRG